MSTRSALVHDRFAGAQAVADAVLYEGYVLYPYRASAAKNQLRWQFGVLTPRAFSEADGSERWRQRTECLVDAGPAAQLTVRLRCLQVQHRAVQGVGEDGAFVPVDTLAVDDRILVPWDEAVDQMVELSPVPLHRAPSGPLRAAINFPAGEELELVRGAQGDVIGRLVRRRQQVDGALAVSVLPADGGSGRWKITVTVENSGRVGAPSARRDEVLERSLVAVHTMLAVDDGRFVSMLDPEPGAAAAVAGCHNDGTFPVLIGDGDVMLSSPIILYDRPEVAPESPGDLYDATEIDEILALRVLTLTDQEKAEARGTDERSAAIVERCDDMPPEMWERLHGALRVLEPEPDPPDGDVAWWSPEADASVDPWSDSIVVGGAEIAKGCAVRLRPARRADAQDLFLAGLRATVAGVFTDVEGGRHVAVTVDGDPAAEELAWQGRYLFFHPDEVEPVSGPGIP